MTTTRATLSGGTTITLLADDLLSVVIPDDAAHVPTVIGDDGRLEPDYGNADWPADDEIATAASELVGRPVRVEFRDKGDTLLEGIYRAVDAAPSTPTIDLLATADGSIGWRVARGEAVTCEWSDVLEAVDQTVRARLDAADMRRWDDACGRGCGPDADEDIHGWRWVVRAASEEDPRAAAVRAALEAIAALDSDPDVEAPADSLLGIAARAAGAGADETLALGRDALAAAASVRTDDVRLVEAIADLRRAMAHG
jgi:hypothetical protein